MDIDKRMEDYFRQGLAQGINTHVIEVSTTVDGKIFLRMQPIQVPTQEQLNRIMPPEVSQWARQQAERDVEMFAQQQQRSGAHLINDVRNFVDLPRMGKMPIVPNFMGDMMRKGLDEFEIEKLDKPRKPRRIAPTEFDSSETSENYKSPLAGME